MKYEHVYSTPWPVLWFHYSNDCKLVWCGCCIPSLHCRYVSWEIQSAYLAQRQKSCWVLDNIAMSIPIADGWCLFCFMTVTSFFSIFKKSSLILHGITITYYSQSLLPSIPREFCPAFIFQTCHNAVPRSWGNNLKWRRHSFTLSCHVTSASLVHH